VKIAWDNSNKHNSNQNFTVLDLFRFKSLRKLTCLLVLTFITIMLGFYVPALMIDQFNFSIYTSALVLSVSEIAAYPLVYFIINCFKRKVIAHFCFGFAFACAVVLLFIWSPGSTQNRDVAENLGTLVAIFLFRFFITI